MRREFETDDHSLVKRACDCMRLGIELDPTPIVVDGNSLTASGYVTRIRITDGGHKITVTDLQ